MLGVFQQSFLRIVVSLILRHGMEAVPEHELQLSQLTCPGDEMLSS